MKRSIFIFLFLSGFLASFLAPVDTGYGFSLDIGGKGGFGFGTVELGGNTQRLHFHGGAGLTADLGFSDLITLEANFMYMAKGGDLTGSTMLFDYVQTPVLAKFFLLDHYYLGAGANLGFAFGSDYSGSTNVMDFGLILAIGQKVPLTKDNDWFITFDFWYDMGLADVASDSQTVNNRSYMFLFGLLYRFQN